MNNSVVERIAARIIEARALSLEEGQEKYRAYFVRTKLYLKYKTEVDSILIVDNCGDCIVGE